MTFQLIRSQDGKIRGLAVMIGRGAIQAARDGKGAWRICDVCKKKPAVVFCTADSDYLCEGCIAAHSMPGFCKYLSIRAAQELVAGALALENPWR